MAWFTSHNRFKRKQQQKPQQKENKKFRISQKKKNTYKMRRRVNISSIYEFIAKVNEPKQWDQSLDA